MRFIQPKLGELKKGQKAVVTKVTNERLLEMGILEGSLVEIIHEAPFGADPIVIRVRGTLIALRRGEANGIEVLIQ